MFDSAYLEFFWIESAFWGLMLFFFVDLAALGVVGLLSLSTVPGVSAALSWDICTENA